MRTACIDPRYGLNPHETYWVFGDGDLDDLLRAIESGRTEMARRILRERRFPLGWQSNK